jgi:predicted SAM-dependent methyltransferase
VKLNLGSDWNHIDNYVSVDMSPKCQPDMLADVCKLPIADDAVEEVYASHVLEHVPCWTDALGEWRRVLAPGGLITVAIPDFLAGYALYRAGEWDLRYFNATIYGAQQMGYREEFAHVQVFSAEMLVERMQEHFPDSAVVDGCTLRESVPGEAMVQGHKA